MVKVKGLISLKGPAALAVVAATGAVCVCLLPVISHCSGVQASPLSLNGGAGEGRPFSPHVDDVAEHTKQRGSMGRAEEEERAIMNHSGRSTAHRRSSSPSSSLAAGSSLFPKSVGSIFLATSALVAAVSLFGLGREGRRGGGGASGRGVEEEGNVEELLRTAGATSGVATAAGLSKPLLSKNVLFSLTALGLLFIASSLAAPSRSSEDAWDEVKVQTPFDCRPNKCTLTFYNGEDGVTRVYRLQDKAETGFQDLELVFPPEYELYLREPEMKRFIRELFTEFFGETQVWTQGSGVKELPVPLPRGVRPEAFLKGRAKKWGEYVVPLSYECKNYPSGGCTMTFPNSAGQNAAVKKIVLNETSRKNSHQVTFTARLPPAFGAETEDYQVVATALENQARLILSAWKWAGWRAGFEGNTRVIFPIPPNLTAEIFHPQRAITPAPDSQDEFFEVAREP